ncbi:unnamed protein product [Triticum aestivum]|uniref:DUF6598 domain-containing protein n=3 Tax=Triticinae TaxID=1648030 RepID=A0A9R1EX12_WHEAT|nr:uncharacterized protein LOC109763544 [Aegilops tauschii subsp. strangulata]XP_044333878.1 uncharacterized protein LOC123054221 [Triticum aestivum]KAF7017849.1 hypothetical protein CFC21_031209 [Triticum aestivum]SPT19485.1 unnamed protein product [Triticum aestivum]
MEGEANGESGESGNCIGHGADIQRRKHQETKSEIEVANKRGQVAALISASVDTKLEMGETEGMKENMLSEIQHEGTKSGTQSATEMVRAEICSLLSRISKKVTELKAEQKLRISDYSSDEVHIHMDNMYSEVTNLLQMMEKVQNSEIPGKEQVSENIGVERIQIRTEDKGGSATKKQGLTYYEYGLNAIFNGLDQLCTRLDQMGHLSYNSQLFSELFKESVNMTKIRLRARIKLDEVDETTPIISDDTLEAANGKCEVSPKISTSTEIKLEIEETKEMGVKAKEKLRKAMMHNKQDEEFFDEYRRGWVSNWSRLYGTFTETTSLSPMHFTHSTPGNTPSAAFVASTLQIYSIQVKEIEDVPGLKWPMEVYGVIAARDDVDHNRNILFSRRRNNCQILNQEDPFLHLTGPSRAIVCEEPVHVEIKLKVKAGTESEDIALMTRVWYYSGKVSCTLYTPVVGGLCTMVLSSEELHESVQATIVGIRLRVPEETPSLFKNGGRVVCFSLPRKGRPRKGRLPNSTHPLFRQVVLQDGAMTSCSKGYLNLSRHVVSVKLCGTLEVVIHANSQSGAIKGEVSIKAQKCNITQDVCHLGDSELEITVAWSRLVQDKLWISMEGSEEV